MPITVPETVVEVDQVHSRDAHGQERNVIIVDERRPAVRENVFIAKLHASAPDELTQPWC